MGRNDVLKNRLFEEGSERFHRLFPDVAAEDPRLARTYVCPLCLKAFPKEALAAKDLDLEHVPPQNQGGPYTKVLLCGRCNSTTGSEIDVHLARRDRVQRVGKPGARPESVTAEFEDVEVTATVQQTEPGSWALMVDRGHSNPESVEAVEQYLGQGRTDWTVSVRSKIGYRPDRWETAYLKIGFLVCFAQGGYSFAAQSAVAPIREQIQDPPGQHLDTSAAILHVKPDEDHGPVLDRCLLSIVDFDFPGLAVSFSRRLIFIPLKTPADEFYGRLRALEQPITFDYQLLDEWPKYPRYLTDDKVIQLGSE